MRISPSRSLTAFLLRFQLIALNLITCDSAPDVSNVTRSVRSQYRARWGREHGGFVLSALSRGTVYALHCPPAIPPVKYIQNLATKTNSFSPFLFTAPPGGVGLSMARLPGRSQLIYFLHRLWLKNTQ